MDSHTCVNAGKPKVTADGEPIIGGPIDRYIPVRAGGLTLHVRDWLPQSAARMPAFVCVHGLASNARTWDAVARMLAAAGHRVVAVDQRGHGLSDKPDNGYDFATVAEDLYLLLDALSIDRPVVAGQSWGGNVALAFGARYPDRAAGLVFVDGGFIDMQMRPDSSWEQISVDLRPPSLTGMPYEDMRGRLRHFHPEWSDEGIEGTLANFEVLPDETIRPWLSLERHMLILRSLWEQRPSDLYGQIEIPVLIAVAADRLNPEWMAVKGAQVDAAAAGLPVAKVVWFQATDHDIHVHKPRRLVDLMLRECAGGL